MDKPQYEAKRVIKKIPLKFCSSLTSKFSIINKVLLLFCPFFAAIVDFITKNYDKSGFKIFSIIWSMVPFGATCCVLSSPPSWQSPCPCTAALRSGSAPYNISAYERNRSKKETWRERCIYTKKAKKRERDSSSLQGKKQHSSLDKERKMDKNRVYKENE